MSQFLLHYSAAPRTRVHAIPIEPEVARKQQRRWLDRAAGMLTFVLGLCSILMIGGGAALFLFNLLTPPSSEAAAATAIQWIRDGLGGTLLSFVLYCLFSGIRFHPHANRARFRSR